MKVEDLSGWRNSNVEDGEFIPSNDATENEWNFSTGPNSRLLNKLSQMPTKMLDVASRIAQGIRTSANEIYVLDLVPDSIDGNIVKVTSKLFDSAFEIEQQVTSSFLQGREIKPYSILSSGKVVIIPYNEENGRMRMISEDDMQSIYPRTYSYLLKNKNKLEEREHGKMKGEFWYAYVYPKNLEVMKARKILVPDIANRGSFALDKYGEYAFTSGYGIILKNEVRESIEFILGILNSKVLDFYLKRISTTLRGGFFRYFTQYIEQLPIRTIDFSDPADVARHDRMVALVEQMLALHKQLPQARTPHEQTALERQIEATDRQIDALVYELYALTEEEIGIVEEMADSLEKTRVLNDGKLKNQK